MAKEFLFSARRLCYRTDSDLLFRLLRGAKKACSDPNWVIYWFSKLAGARFIPKAPVFPSTVFVEPTNVCNFACVHCPYPQLSKKSDYQHGFMDFDLYRKVVDEASRYKYAILRPFGRGESLIDPRISQMIRYAKDRRMGTIWLNTNGMLLSSHKSTELLNAGLDWLEVSIDAVTAETFSTIKGVGADAYRHIVENTVRYSDIKKGLFPNNYRKMLIVSFVESRINASEKNGFIRFWQRYADLIRIRPMHRHCALVQDALRIPGNGNRTERFPCSCLWRRATIDYQGNFSFCDSDWETRTVVGNIGKSTIREIWNSDTYKKIRQMHIDRKFDGVPLCGECKSYYECGRWY